MYPTITTQNRRRHDLDNLRTFLTILVIYHHTSLFFGGPPGFPFRSKYLPSHPDDLIVLFLIINQSYFMGLFFWISGYFSAQALTRCLTTSHISKFVKGKLLRLGLPAVVFTLIFHPMAAVLEREMESPSLLTIGEILKIYWEVWTGLDGVKGPVWYLATLLGFDLVAAGIKFLRLRYWKERSDIDEMDSWGQRKSVIILLWAITMPAAFFIRLVYPVGRTIPIFDLQLGYSPQYFFAYWLGHQVYHCHAGSFLDSLFNVPHNDTNPTDEEQTLISNDPLDDEDPRSNPTIATSHPSSYRFTNLSIYSAFSLSLLAIILIGLLSRLSPSHSDPSYTAGGWNPSALLYAIWGEISFALISPSLVRHFTKHHNSPKTGYTGYILRSRYSYAAFLDHMPISVCILVGFDELFGERVAAWIGESRGLALWMLPVLAGVLGTVDTVASFLVGRGLVEVVPGVGRVI